MDALHLEHMALKYLKTITVVEAESEAVNVGPALSYAPNSPRG